MKTLLTLISLFLFLNQTNAQFAYNILDFELKKPPNTAYKITQTENSEVTRISEFDKDNQLIFDYSASKVPFFGWKDPLRTIYGYEYDSLGRITTKYDFNSNGGLSIYSNEYGVAPPSKTIYKQEFIPEKESDINSNPFAYISKFTSLKELKQSKESIQIFSAEKEFSRKEIFDNEGKLIQMKRYDFLRKDSTTTTFTYNAEGREIYKTTVGSKKDVYRKNKTEYVEDAEIIEILDNNGKEMVPIAFFATKTTKNTETEYSENKQRLKIRHEVYDNNGYLLSSTVYETVYEGELIIPITKDLPKTAEMIYTYNQDGLLKKETMTNYKSGKKVVKKYNYKIELIK